MLLRKNAEVVIFKSLYLYAGAVLQIHISYLQMQEDRAALFIVKELLVLLFQARKPGIGLATFKHNGLCRRARRLKVCAFQWNRSTRNFILKFTEWQSVSASAQHRCPNSDFNQAPRNMFKLPTG
jgi:hypothetical protein